MRLLSSPRPEHVVWQLAIRYQVPRHAVDGHSRRVPQPSSTTSTSTPPMGRASTAATPSRALRRTTFRQLHRLRAAPARGGRLGSLLNGQSLVGGVRERGGYHYDRPRRHDSPLPEQPTNDTLSSLSGAGMRLSSLRRLSSTFINSLRTRKPLSQKDAENINKWRFAKLKEHIEGNLEVENEAFDRYMHNVSLLEETFSVNSLKDSMPVPGACSSEDDFSRLVTGIKVRLKSNPERANNFRERIQGFVIKGLEKLKELEFHDDEVSLAEDLDSLVECKRRKKILKSRFDQTAAVEDLVDKLIKARSEDDLKSCLETKLQLFNQDGCLASCKSSHHIADVVAAKDSSNTVTAAFSYSLPKLFSTVQVREDSVSNIDEEFYSLNQIAEL